VFLFDRLLMLTQRFNAVLFDDSLPVTARLQNDLYCVGIGIKLYSLTAGY